jgi:hypothetical protein
MKITITGRLHHIIDVCKLIGASHTSVNVGRGGASKRRYEVTIATRGVIRKALDVIRHDPKQKTLADNLVRVLGGSDRLTLRLFKNVQRIAAEHNGFPGVGG